MPRRIYDTLKLSFKDQQTRLLTLDRARTRPNKLHFCLQNVSLNDSWSYFHPGESDCPSFNALSYTWEPRLPERTIYINGQAVTVGYNLYTFLEILHQSPPSPKFMYWWIDALCIDQSDDDEKSYQVPLMRTIYGHYKCRLLFIWLGKEFEMAASVRSLSSRQTWEALGLVLRHQYFARTWIVQEFLVCRSQIMIGAGNAAADVDTLSEFLTSHVSEIQKEQIPQAALLLFLLRSEARERIESNDGIIFTDFTRLPLAQCIQLFGSNQCTDQRDKLYGLLGVTEIAQRPKVSYTASIIEVFCSAVYIVMSGLAHGRGLARSRSHSVYEEVSSLLILSREMGLSAMYTKHLCDFLKALKEKALRLSDRNKEAGAIVNHEFLTDVAFDHDSGKWAYDVESTWYKFWTASTLSSRGMFMPTHKSIRCAPDEKNE